MAGQITIGIDLGTTYSAASVMRGGATPIRIKFPGDGNQLQSAVCFDENQTPHVGRKARAAAFKNPGALCVQFKRKIPTAPFEPVSDGGPTPVELSAIVLGHIFRTILQILPEVRQAAAEARLVVVVTRPASYRVADQQALTCSAELVGDNFTIHEFFSEPVAGSLFFRRQHSDKLRDGHLIVVVDVGGGTTDITLLRFSNGVSDELLADRGDGQLGGINFTGTVFQHFCEDLGYRELAGCFDPRVGLQFGIPTLSDTDRRLAALLYDKCDALKIALSADETAQEYLETQNGLAELVLSREQFVELNRDSYSRFDRAVSTALDGTQFSWPEVNHVVLIGGSAMLPGLRHHLARITDRSVNAIYVDTESENVVSDGAAFLGHSGERAAQVLAGGCGIRVRRRRQGQGDPESSFAYKMFFLPGQVISSSGETVESLGQFLDSPGSDVEFEMEFCEAKPGVQVQPPTDGSLPLLNPEQVVPIHSIRHKCRLPQGRHEVQLGFDYRGHILHYRVGFRDLPGLEVLSGTVMDGSTMPSESTVSTRHNIAILLDCSSSMLGNDKLPQAKQAVYALLEGIDENNTQATLVAFGKEVKVVAPLSSKFAAIKKAVDKLVADGGTPMAEALEFGIKELSKTKDDHQRIIVLVSDGQPFNVGETKARAKEAKEKEIRVVTVGVGSDAAEDLLQQHLASSPSDYFFASSAHELVGIFQSIAELYIND